VFAFGDRRLPPAPRAATPLQASPELPSWAAVADRSRDRSYDSAEGLPVGRGEVDLVARLLGWLGLRGMAARTGPTRKPRRVTSSAPRKRRPARGSRNMTRVERAETV